MKTFSVELYQNYTIFTWFHASKKPLSCWTRIYPVFANSVDPNQLASEEANWSGSKLFAIKFVKFIATIRIKQADWLKIRSGRDILIYSAWQGLKWIWNGAFDESDYIALLIYANWARTQHFLQIACAPSKKSACTCAPSERSLHRALYAQPKIRSDLDSD